MKAVLVGDLPVGTRWLYEVKLDGYRALPIKNGSQIKVFSGRGNDLTRDFPQIATAVKTVQAKTCVLDGEIVAIDPEGRHSFQALQSRGAVRPGWHVVLYAFDLLHLDGHDLLDWPLHERKAKLERVLAGSSVLLCPELRGDPKAIIFSVKDLGFEGIVAKLRDSKYESGDRSGAWRKFKTSPAQEFVVAGLKPSANSAESLLVGYYEGRSLKFAGKVRAGLTPLTRRKLWDRLKPLIQPNCPFAELNIVKSSRWSGGITEEDLAVVQWTKPRLVVQVAFVEWTRDALLRHPRFLGIRDDKRAEEVVLEGEKHSSAEL